MNEIDILNRPFFNRTVFLFFSLYRRRLGLKKVDVPVEKPAIPAAQPLSFRFRLLRRTDRRMKIKKNEWEGQACKR